MTQNQIDFYNAFNKRQRDVVELAETGRSNLAREAETRRSNLVAEAERQRSNLANEAETRLHNRIVESETARSNKEQELLKDRGLNIDFLREGVAEREANIKEKQLDLNKLQYALNVAELDLEKYKAGEKTGSDILDGVLNIAKTVIKLVTGK